MVKKIEEPELTFEQRDAAASAAYASARTAVDEAKRKLRTARQASGEAIIAWTNKHAKKPTQREMMEAVNATQAARDKFIADQGVVKPLSHLDAVMRGAGKGPSVNFGHLRPRIGLRA